MKLKVFENGVYSEIEKALVNMDTKEIIMSGDYYHDKIDEHMEGFLMGLKYAKVKYELLEPEVIIPEHEMFNKCDFYNEEE